MALEDFEKQLARQKEDESRRDRHHGERKPDHKHHRHHHHSSTNRDSYHDEDRHRSKRRRYSQDEDDEKSRSRHKHKRRRESRGEDEVEQPSRSPTLLKRDAWMEGPSSLDIDFVQRRKKETSPPRATNLGQDFEKKLHEKELNHHLRDLRNGKDIDELETKPAEHEVEYKFGDAGSHWRMTKLKAVYRQAEQSGQRWEDAALERFDSLRDFDDAREEEMELDRRETYGDGYVGKVRPSGELFQERKLESGVHRGKRDMEPPRGTPVTDIAAPSPAPVTVRLDQTALNRLKAQLMKAQLRKDPIAAELEKQYNEALATSTSNDPTVVQLSAMDSRMLSSAPRNEAKTVQNRRGAERGQVEENEEMSVDDMVREERRTRGQAGGEGMRLAERIAKDGKFDNDLEYMDENASKLAKRVHKSDGNLRNIAINEYQKISKILDNCPLCHHEDTETPPIAPVVSLATRTYLTLPTEPELGSFGAMIIPMQHRTNLLECDDDEWEEIRNFMKSLTRMYHDQGRNVIFYENAAHPNRKPHAGLNVVPLPYSLGETAPAFFKEAFLTAEDEWSQHKKIIDTLAKSKQGLGKLAFRRTLVSQMPYFHVWFELDGGIGHVVEEPDRWPRGDLFAREIIGGMLGLEPDIIKRQGRWQRGHDPRIEVFRKKWRKFDWTRVLTEGAI
jgi:Protein similar to CwfJ C-terminus 2/Protein similar to CwfJ C-terminus 1